MLPVWNRHVVGQAASAVPAEQVRCVHSDPSMWLTTCLSHIDDAWWQSNTFTHSSQPPPRYVHLSTCETWCWAAARTVSVLQHGVLLSSSDSSHTAHDSQCHTRSMSHSNDMALRSMSHNVNVTQQRHGAKEDNLQWSHLEWQSRRLGLTETLNPELHRPVRHQYCSVIHAASPEPHTHTHRLTDQCVTNTAV